MKFSKYPVDCTMYPVLWVRIIFLRTVCHHVSLLHIFAYSTLNARYAFACSELYSFSCLAGMYDLSPPHAVWPCLDGTLPRSFQAERLVLPWCASITVYVWLDNNHGVEYITSHTIHVDVSLGIKCRELKTVL